MFILRIMVMLIAGTIQMVSIWELLTFSSY